MSFSQANITGVNPPVQHGTELLLSWSSTAAVGTVFQVYLNQQLVWSGVGLKCSIPLPSTLSRIDIGTVGPGEDQVPFGSTLPAAPARGHAPVARRHLRGSRPGRLPYLRRADAGKWDRFHDNPRHDPRLHGWDYYRRVRLRWLWSGGLRSGGRLILVDVGASLEWDMALGRQTVRHRGERRAGFRDGRRDFRSTAFPSFVLGRDATSLSVQPGGTNGASYLECKSFGVNLQRSAAGGSGAPFAMTTRRKNEQHLHFQRAARDAGVRRSDLERRLERQLFDAGRLGALGSLTVTTTEVPSASLNIRVAAGNYLNQDGTIGTFAGVASQALTISATNYLYLDLTNSGTLTVNTTGFPSTAHVRLAVVIAGAGTISSIAR